MMIVWDNIFIAIPIFNDYIISQTIQIDSMIQYCKRQNLKLLIIETELIGFNRPLNLEDIICGNRKGLAKKYCNIFG